MSVGARVLVAVFPLLLAGCSAGPPSSPTEAPPPTSNAPTTLLNETLPVDLAGPPTFGALNAVSMNVAWIDVKAELQPGFQQSDLDLWFNWTFEDPANWPRESTLMWEYGNLSWQGPVLESCMGVYTVAGGAAGFLGVAVRVGGANESIDPGLDPAFPNIGGKAGILSLQFQARDLDRARAGCGNDANTLRAFVALPFLNDTVPFTVTGHWKNAALTLKGGPPDGSFAFSQEDGQGTTARVELAGNEAGASTGFSRTGRLGQPGRSMFVGFCPAAYVGPVSAGLDGYARYLRPDGESVNLPRYHGCALDFDLGGQEWTFQYDTSAPMPGAKFDVVFGLPYESVDSPGCHVRCWPGKW